MKKLIYIFSLALLMLSGACSNASDAKKEGEMVQNEAAAVDESGVVTDGPGYKIKDNIIFSESLPVVVDFYATWCPPCKQYAPIFDEVKEKYGNQAIFMSIDIDKNPDLAKSYGVTAVPYTVFIQPGGVMMGKESGLLKIDKLEAFVNQLIATTDGEDLSI